MLSHQETLSELEVSAFFCSVTLTNLSGFPTIYLIDSDPLSRSLSLSPSLQESNLLPSFKVQGTTPPLSCHFILLLKLCIQPKVPGTRSAWSHLMPQSTEGPKNYACTSNSHLDFSDKVATKTLNPACAKLMPSLSIAKHTLSPCPPRKVYPTIILLLRKSASQRRPGKSHSNPVPQAGLGVHQIHVNSSHSMSRSEEMVLWAGGSIKG